MLSSRLNYSAIWKVKYVWQHGWGKCNVPTATENFRGKFVQKSISGKFGKIRAKYSSHPQKLACSYTYASLTASAAASLARAAVLVSTRANSQEYSPRLWQIRKRFEKIPTNLMHSIPNSVRTHTPTKYKTRAPTQSHRLEVTSLQLWKKYPSIANATIAT